MIKGTGIDLADVDRVGAMIKRFGNRFTRRVFTPAEISYCEGRKEPAYSYAARFAAKEAAMKALGKGWGSGVRFKQIEVVAGRTPSLLLHGEAEKEARRQGVGRLHLSLTHEKGLAAAVAVAEDNKSGE
ncbi:MAG: holo-ACP synthase [bacterium]